MRLLRLGYVRFTGCCGCQLTLLNSEAEMAALAKISELVLFPMASSRKDEGEALDLVLVEGSVSRPEELEELLELRRRARTLAAVGACALTGGVNRLAGRDRSSLCEAVYRETAAGKNTFPPQPLRRFVPVDLEIAGCPPEGREMLEAIGAALRGTLPPLPEYPVCMECRQRENRCLLLEDRLPCLGPVTRAGCRALCPSAGIACEGCRGEAPEANRREAFRLLLGTGLSEREVHARMSRFTGEGHENS